MPIISSSLAISAVQLMAVYRSLSNKADTKHLGSLDKYLVSERGYLKINKDGGVTMRKFNEPGLDAQGDNNVE